MLGVIFVSRVEDAHYFV